MIATYADDTAITASHTDPITASINLQKHLDILQLWLKKWRIKINDTKSVHITFTTKKLTCPPVQINNTQIPQSENVKYLGMHLDRRLTWKKHLITKRLQLNIKLRGMYWLIGRPSRLSIANKLLIYKSIIKPIWTYGIQLWGTAADSNIEIIQRFQSKVLRCITNAPWYVSNEIIKNDLQMTTVREKNKTAQLRIPGQIKDTSKQTHLQWTFKHHQQSPKD